MAEPFRTTPAMRVFGAGLPTFRGTPILASRDRLSPQLRQNALMEDQIRNEEAQIGLQQRQLERQFQLQDAENAAFEDLQKGEEIGNIYRKNPVLAMSPHFRNLVAMQPSRASQTLAPSLAQKLPPQYRERFFKSLETPEFAQNPLGALTAIEMEKDIDEQRGKLAEQNVPVHEYPRQLFTPEEFSGIINKHKTPKGGDPRMVALKEHFDMVQERKKAMLDAGLDQIENPAFAAGNKSASPSIPNPEFLDLTKEESKLYNLLSSGYRNLYAPAPAVAPEVEKKEIPQAEGSKDTMGKINPTALSEEDVNKEVQEALNQPEADENTYSAAINNPRASLDVKKQAVDKLKQFLKSPPEREMDKEQWDAWKKGLEEEISKGERQIRMVPEMEKYEAALAKDKKQIGDWIGEFAKTIGVPPRTAELSIQRKNYYKEQFDDFLRKKMGISGVFGPLGRDAENLKGLKWSEFADEMGLLGPIPGFRNIMRGKTYGDVLDDYLAEKFVKQRGLLSASPVASQIPEATRSQALDNVMNAIDNAPTKK